MIEEGCTIVLATRNQGKTKEFREAFQRLGVHIKDLHEFEGIPPIEESGETFVENAYLKAKIVAEAVSLLVLADDSGLCVDALDGAPGVYSARYAGEEAKDADNNAKLLRELRLKGETVRSSRSSDPELLSSARFVCSLVLYDPEDGSQLQAEGSVEGFILSETRGADGFGYDPLFWIPSYNRSMAELTVEEKNKISHRGQALNRLLELVAKSGQ
jgi:XTP/dITP diphosphohydrolase